MADRFVSSGLTKKNIRFKVQIGDYSKYVCKGYYTSPEFGEDDCEWSLLVHVYDGADHENFIDVRLRRLDSAAEEQILKVKTSIVSALGLKVFKNERTMPFANDARILAVAKADLNGYYGLKKWFYLPNDTLTLQCDLVVHETSVSAYERWENSTRNISRDTSNFLENFSHSRLVKKADDYFDRRITDFSLRACGGRIVTSEYTSERLGGKWSLVVCGTAEDNFAEYLDIRIMRQESYEDQLIKIRLSIVDRSDKVMLSKEKDVHFTSSREVQLLTLNEKTIPSWFGILKKDLIPDNTLTLHCEMILYKQVDDVFSRKETFDSRIEAYGYAPTQLLPYFAAILLILTVALHNLYWCFTCYAIYLAFIPIYLIAVIAITFFFIYVKNKAEEIKEKEMLREIRKKIREERKKMMLDQVYENGTDNYVKNELFSRKPNYPYHVKNEYFHSRKPKNSVKKYRNYY